MSDMMQDIEKARELLGGEKPLSEFERHKAMSSFQELFRLVRERPRLALKLLDEIAQVPEEHGYTADASVLYFMGVLQGILAERFNRGGTVERVLENHAWVESFRPADYMGTKRRFFRP